MKTIYNLVPAIMGSAAILLILLTFVLIALSI